MSVWKKLNKQDSFVTTYVAKKQWNLSGNQLDSAGVKLLPAYSNVKVVDPEDSAELNCSFEFDYINLGQTCILLAEGEVLSTCATILEATVLEVEETPTPTPSPIPPTPTPTPTNEGVELTPTPTPTNVPVDVTPTVTPTNTPSGVPNTPTPTPTLPLYYTLTKCEDNGDQSPGFKSVQNTSELPGLVVGDRVRDNVSPNNYTYFVDGFETGIGGVGIEAISGETYCPPVYNYYAMKKCTDPADILYIRMEDTLPQVTDNPNTASVISVNGQSRYAYTGVTKTVWETNNGVDYSGTPTIGCPG
mgnify:CR=1 FL=1